MGPRNLYSFKSYEVEHKPAHYEWLVTDFKIDTSNPRDLGIDKVSSLFEQNMNQSAEIYILSMKRAGKAVDWI